MQRLWALASLLALVACTAGVPAESGSGLVLAATPCVRTTATTDSSRLLVHTVHPDECGVTNRRLTIVADALDRFRQTNGAYPGRLDDLLGMPVEPPVLPTNERWFSDGWGPFRYVRFGNGYELRSAGSDGRFDTVDDVMESGTDS